MESEAAGLWGGMRAVALGLSPKIGGPELAEGWNVPLGVGWTFGVYDPVQVEG